MADAVAHGRDEDEPRRNRHSGPRKRRPKKKKKKKRMEEEEEEKKGLQLSRRLNDSVVFDRSRDVYVPPLQSSVGEAMQDQIGRCSGADSKASLCDSSEPYPDFATSSMAPDPTPTTALLPRQVYACANGSLISFETPCEVSRPSTSRSFRQLGLSTEERAALKQEQAQRTAERAYWTQWVINAAEKERSRRLNVLKQLQFEEEEEVQRRRQWAIATIEKEQKAMMRELFLDNMKNTQWFQSTISRFSKDYEVVCPNSWCGCTYSCMLKDLELHLGRCAYRQVPDNLDQVVEDGTADLSSYDVVCPNAMLGCKEICSRKNLVQHLAICSVNGISREKEWEERLEWRKSVNQATEKERERRMDEEREEGRVNGCGLSFGNLQRLYEEQTAMMQVVLHDEILAFIIITSGKRLKSVYGYRKLLQW